MKLPKPNKGKKLVRMFEKKKYARYPIQTAIVMPGQSLFRIIQKATKGLREPDDLLLIAESVVAIAQRRAYVFDRIRPSRLATFLSGFVSRVPYGIGLGRPQTMHLAIKECGVLRILFATLVAAITRPFGLRGMFYRVAGRKAALIDGPCAYTLPPFNKYATLGPKNPYQVSRDLARRLNCSIAIVDANDIGTICIGNSGGFFERRRLKKMAETLTRDNPMGQSGECTPVLLVRKVNKNTTP